MSSMFIGGKWVAAASGETIPVLSPVDGATFGAIARARDVDVDTAVRAAQRALEGAWGRMTATERGRVLSRDVLLTDVWGYKYTGGTRTVDVHVRRLREKLPALGDALVTVKQFGYKLLELPPAV